LEKQYNDDDCLYVTTGAPVPSFFDTVIPIEHTQKVDHKKICIKQNYKIGQFIRPKGSDITQG
jgi:molybdopterin molybdotransferase